MSEQEYQDRIPSADELTSILESQDTPAAPAPATETTAPAAPAQETVNAAAPAPAAADKPAASPLALSDDALVTDPADGNVRKWGEIKAERLRQQDYTRKTMALAEERRTLAAERERINAEAQRIVAEAEAFKAMKGVAGQPDLPEDDPYAQRIMAQAKQIDAMRQAMAAVQQQVEHNARERELAASRAALEAKETALREQFKLSDRDLGAVEREYVHRRRVGEMVTLDSVAEEYRKHQDEIREAAVAEWKEKNRATGTVAAAAKPAGGAAPPPIDVRSEGFLEMIRGHLSAL